MPVPRDSQEVGANPEEVFMQEKMMDPKVAEYINGLPVEERANAMRQMYQDYTGQGVLNTEAMSQADALRSGGAPQGVQAGNQFVAASPLSHIARGVNDYRGNRDYKAAQAKKEALSQDQTEGLSRYAGAQGGINMPPQQPPQPEKPSMLSRAGTTIADLLRSRGR